MKLENGYKLIYEVIENGTRSFKASKTGVPAENDYVLMTCEIGANKLVYENNGKFYGTGAKFVPTYNEDGTSADTQLITDEAYAEVFVAKTDETEAVTESVEEPAANADSVVDPEVESKGDAEEPVIDPENEE